jgi:ActD protein
MRTLVASFGSEADLVAALPRLRDLGAVETYTPKALEDDTPSVLPLVVLILGFLGAGAGFAMQSYANIVGYPVDIGGRPEFSWPAFVPIAFEIGVLFAVLGGFIGFLVVNRLPRLYDPVDEADLMRGALRDRWCLAIRTEAPERTHEVLRSLSVEQVEELPA